MLGSQTLRPLDDSALSPWSKLPPQWNDLRASLLGAPVDARDGAEATALELLVLGGLSTSSPGGSWAWSVPDALAGTRLVRLAEAVLPGECTITRELSGGAHPYLSFRVETTTAVAPSHEYAVLKEQRRLDAGDRWLAGSFDPAALARALWRGTLLKTPPLRQAGPGLAVFRLPSRHDARALAAAADLLGIGPARLERRFDLWRVQLAVDDLDARLPTLAEALAG